MLLKRNELFGIATTAPEADMLEKYQIIPQWLLDEPTPWSLVAFFEQTLQRSFYDGEPKSLFKDYATELRPAKALLAKYGAEGAAQVILDQIDNLSGLGSFTLWSIIRKEGKGESGKKRKYASSLQPISRP